MYRTQLPYSRAVAYFADEIVQHLTRLSGAQVAVTLDINADLPLGASEDLVRTLTENGRTLKFQSQGFEEE